MYLRSIKLENIRGFRDLDLDLTRPDGSLAGWTVIAGRNGAGKTTLLKAIVLASRRGQAPEASWIGRASWVRTNTKEGIVFLEEDSGVLAESHWIGGGSLSEGEPAKPPSRPHLRLLPSLSAYGAQRRLNGQGGVGDDLDPRIARVRSLFEEDVSLREAIDWLRNQVYLRALEGDKKSLYTKEAFLCLLNDGLLPDSARVDRIDSDGLWISQGELELSLAQMADGYRAVASLVTDIVSRFFEEGTLEVQRHSRPRSGARIQVTSPGVILIDEVEQHLHVTWQRRIGFWLKAHFPNVQFIVTTHSPFVCQAADPGGLIRLSGPNDSSPAQHVPKDVYHTVVNGSLDDAVLSELFGLESAFTESAEVLRDRLAVLEASAQDRKLTPANLAELESLRKKMPRSMSSDVENVIRRLAKSA